MENPAVALNSQELAEYLSGGNGIHVSPETAQKLTAVYACIYVLSSTLAQLPINVLRKVDGKITPGTDHPAHYLLHDEPNQWQTSYKWRETKQAHTLGWGNGYSRLVRGRVALLGDAGHSTTPDIGQGGCAAMEDAVVLGAVFRQTRDIAAALREYEAQRCDRVRDLVLKARKRCDITHGKDMQLTEAWYQELREETGERIINGMCDTILSGPLG